MPKQASWIHGNAIVAEHLSQRLVEVTHHASPSGPVTDSDVVGLRRGWGVTFVGKAETSNWFHAPIPTPTFVDDAQVHLDRVFVFFDAKREEVFVNAVHVWDGPNRIEQFVGLSVSGNHSKTIRDGSNSFDVVRSPRVHFGIGISVLVRFRQSEAITFTTAGADFITRSR